MQHHPRLAAVDMNSICPLAFFSLLLQAYYSSFFLSFFLFAGHIFCVERKPNRAAANARDRAKSREPVCGNGSLRMGLH